MSDPIRILIADDHAVVRHGLRALFTEERDLTVVAEARNGEEAIAAAGRDDVDLMVLDLSMPGLNGARVAETVLASRPEFPIVVLTMHEDEYYLQELLRIGARAFVLKKSDSSTLIDAIRASHRGQRYVDPALGGSIIAGFCARRARHDSPSRLDLLTPREQEVCRLLAFGNTNGEIARKLGISARTAESHRKNLMKKLAVTSRADLVSFAIEHGLMKPE